MVLNNLAKTILVSAMTAGVIACSATDTASTSSNAKQANQSADLIAVNPTWLNQSYANYRAGDETLKRVVASVVKAADQALTKPTVSVLDKTLVAPSGDKQDYISVGPYWWPDPSKPDGLPWIKRDGKTNPASKTTGSDKPAMNDMLMYISSLSLAYYYTKEEKYAEKAASFIKTWFLNPQTRMNPSLDYGQAVPGAEDGRPYGIIETRWFIRLLDDIGLISNSKHFDETAQQQFKTWVSEYTQWLITNPLGQGACDAHNNHGTYCEAQIAAYALFTGQKDLAKQYVERVFKHRLAEQVKPNGAQPDELARTRPIHYSVFNLEAYVFAARVGDHLGMDMWNYQAANGASIKQMIDFILPSIKQQGYWQNVKDKKMRMGRLFYFLQYAHIKYGDVKYQQAISDLMPLVAEEDRSEFAQCLLIMPKPDNLSLSDLVKVDPTGEKSTYRCYY
ncbi:alginate lyase family protein [Catenovulum agarivorans]|uniref:alginate lyase family protein n=1 Tax=Catenovulum agarivorans TaxID=1172192 RepID=UPI000316109E|nr:alginate lyase family protein [Catenovulum agarivorans]